MSGPEPRPHIAALADYPLGGTVPDGETGRRIFALANNELAHRPTERVLAAATDALTRSRLYPEPTAQVLRGALAEHHGLTEAGIVCANGSSELISLLCTAFLGPGDEALASAYSYLYFSTAARIAGATLVKPNPARPDGSVRAASQTIDTAPAQATVDALLGDLSERTRVVFLDNPSNPLGSVLPWREVMRLHRALPENVLLILDAAYAEYATDDRFASGEALVHSAGNVTVLRTFSKIYGLAGLRVGWAYAPESIAAVLHKLRQPNNLSGPSIAGALAALSETDVMARRQREAVAVRKALSDRLGQWPVLKVRPSHTNFVLVDVTPDESSHFNADVLGARLAEEGVLVRGMRPYGLPDALRVTLCALEEVDEVVARFERALGSMRCMGDRHGEASE